jgi:hypothetical protein
MAAVDYLMPNPSSKQRQSNFCANKEPFCWARLSPRNGQIIEAQDKLQEVGRLLEVNALHHTTTTWTHQVHHQEVLLPHHLVWQQQRWELK